MHFNKRDAHKIYPYKIVIVILLIILAGIISFHFYSTNTKNKIIQNQNVQLHKWKERCIFTQSLITGIIANQHPQIILTAKEFDNE